MGDRVKLPPLTVRGSPNGNGKSGARKPMARSGRKAPRGTKNSPRAASRQAAPGTATDRTRRKSARGVGVAGAPAGAPGAGAVGATGSPAKGKKLKVPKLPPHLAAKVKDPAYDMDLDTSLTDEEIALLERWKAAKEAAQGGGPRRKRKKKLPQGVAEDLSDMPVPPMTTEALEAYGGVPPDIDLKRLLLPNGKVPTGVANLCVYYCPAALEGWVSQHSPACAAASTAGAWNALLGRTRYHPSAAGQDVVVGYMEKILEDKITAKRTTLSRTIPETELEKVLEAFAASMQDDGMKPYSWESAKAQGSDMVPRLRAVIAENDFKHSQTLMAMEDGVRKRKGQKEKKGGDKKEKEKSDLGENKSVINDDVIEDEGDGAGGGTSTQSPWQQLIQLLLMYTGLAKITCDRPSTSFFGNDGIFQSLKMLQNSNPDVAIHGESFMGRPKDKSKDIEVRVQKKDSTRTVADQWIALREEFMRFNTMLLFHQTNHYSLIFALREWMDPRGTRHRQVLTAKRGQRPTAWIDFHEVRKILLQWQGHKILKIVRSKPNSFVDDWKCGAIVDIHKGPERIPTPPEADVDWSAWNRFVPGNHLKSEKL